MNLAGNISTCTVQYTYAPCKYNEELSCYTAVILEVHACDKIAHPILIDG